MIVGVAIRWASIIPDAVPWVITATRPARHSDVLIVAAKFALQDKAFAKARRKRLSGEQGFIDDAGNFLTREEAAQHALACGQPRRLRGDHGEDLGWGTFDESHKRMTVFSEDLW